MRPVRTILVPTDFSEASRKAIDYACGLADVFGASLHVLHVLENPFAPGAYMEMYAPPSAEFIEDLDRRTRETLEAQLTPEQREKYRAVFEMRTGTAAREILDVIKTHGSIDLVVMATAGRGGVARLMMGSVADKIVRSAPCPVLTVHPHDRPDAPEAVQAA